MFAFDADNPVLQLCAAGMQVDGEPDKALALFEQAWNARRDDFDASVAAHFVARHQPTPGDALRWNEIAMAHCELITDSRKDALLPSLCLNLGESYRINGQNVRAAQLAARGSLAIAALPPDDGYAGFVRAGLARLADRLQVSDTNHHSGEV